jgi:hypothetical protein
MDHVNPTPGEVNADGRVGPDSPSEAIPVAGMPPRPGKLPVVLAVCWILALSVIFTRPVAFRGAREVAGQPGDNLYFVWLLDWYERAVFDLHQSPVFDPWLNFPEGWSLASTQFPQAMVWLGLPVSMSAGAVAGYNFSALASFFLSGMGVFVYVRRWTGRTVPALVAGTLFGFAPYRQAHFLIGHLDLLGTFWPALYLLALIDICIGKGRSIKAAGLLCGFLVATAFTSPYYIYMCLLLTAPIVAAYWLIGKLRGETGRRARTLLAVGLGVSLPLVVMAIWPYLELARSGAIGARSREYVRSYSSSPTDYVLPPTTSVVWGTWVSTHFDRAQWVEGTLYVGVVGAGLLILSLVRRRRLGQTESGLVVVCLALAGTAFILSLGPDLMWMSSPVQIQVPEFARTWHPGPEAYVPMPGRLLFEFLPLYSSMRVPMRFGVFVILSVGIMAGLGAGQIVTQVRHPGLQGIIGGLLVLMVAVDFLPHAVPVFEVRPRAVDLWLRDDPGEGAVAQFPFNLEEDQSQVYYTSIHRKPFLGGMFNAFPPAQYQRIRPIMDNFPDASSVALLEELGVQYVVVKGDGYADYPAVEAEIERFGLCPAVALEGEHVYTWCAD